MKLSGLTERTVADLAAQEKSNQTVDDLVVDGYRFNSPADAAAAREEIKKQKYIEQHLDFDKPEEVLEIYDKMITNKIFVTPLGFYFLKKIQMFLQGSSEIPDEKIKPLPLGSVYTQRAKNEAMAVNRPKPVRKDDMREIRQKYVLSVCFNIFLVIAVIAMFIIAMNSETPNILNYKQVIENQYSEWDESLTEREKAVRQKEKELGITYEAPSETVTESSSSDE